MKIVIVGGVAGGATAMARLRRLDENAEIVLFERGKYISFANCGLPYYVGGGAIASRDALFVSTKEKFEKDYGVDIRVESEVIRIDPANKTVDVYDRANEKHYTETYDKLLLSTGSQPFVPKCPAQITPTYFSCGRSQTWIKLSSSSRKSSPPKTRLWWAAALSGWRWQKILLTAA